MNVIRFEPWSLMSLLHRDVDRAFAGRPLSRPNGREEAADWRPAGDVRELKNRFVLRPDLPGLRAEDIEVRMEDGVLTLAGERPRESDEEIDGLRHIERSSGRFLRRFPLPESADADGITARSANGILEINIPKQPEVQARRRLSRIRVACRKNHLRRKGVYDHSRLCAEIGSSFGWL